MRFGDYYIELGLDASDFLSMTLLSLLWFLGIFAFRMSLVFLELLPQLATLPEDFRLSPRLELVTWQPFLTSIVVALVLGPVTHSALTRAAAIKVYRELAQTDDVGVPFEPGEPDYPGEPGDGEDGENGDRNGSG
jgi:hypothetical protein